MSTHWPQMLSAAARARQAVQSTAGYKFEFLKPEEVAEVDAVSARIIPTDDTPGAREAGVIYFIDRALMTFASGDQQKYKEGLPELQSLVREMFSGVVRFSAATPDQQDEVLRSMDHQNQSIATSNRNRRSAETFFEAVRIQTITGFLIEPESGGNPDGVGWKLLGREAEHTFRPPFGYYDKNYPGWQPVLKQRMRNDG